MKSLDFSINSAHLPHGMNETTRFFFSTFSLQSFRRSRRDLIVDCIAVVWVPITARLKTRILNQERQSDYVYVLIVFPLAVQCAVAVRTPILIHIFSRLFKEHHSKCSGCFQGLYSKLELQPILLMENLVSGVESFDFIYVPEIRLWLYLRNVTYNNMHKLSCCIKNEIVPVQKGYRHIVKLSRL